MKKFMKIILAVVLVLVLLIGGFLFSPLLSMSAKKGIEHFGSQILHTEVSVKSVSINVLKGDISIGGLVVANPEGFQEPYAFKLDKIAVDVDMKSLRGDTLVINSIMIDAPNIVLENMGANLKALTANLDKPVKSDGAESKEVKSKPAKKLVIADLTLMNANVKIKEGLEVKIPDINLKNLGTADNAASIKEVVSKVLNSVTRESLGALVETGRDEIRKSFKTLFN